jgi:hypothetical protein
MQQCGNAAMRKNAEEDLQKCTRRGEKEQKKK